MIPMMENNNNCAEEYCVYRNYTEVINTNEEEGSLGNWSDEFRKNCYSSWCQENEATVSQEQIYNCFKRLGQVFGFQHDNVLNMFDHFMVQLDSRSSRMGCPRALLSLHCDYIGGENSNYKKWYFAAYIHTNTKLSKSVNKPLPKKSVPYELHQLDSENSWLAMQYKWKLKMHNLTDLTYVYQIGLYLLIWGEANNVRFMPECICFIYQCAWDYFESVVETSDLQQAHQFTFLNNIITPLYSYVRDQQYKLVNKKFVKREREHDSVIGYDDINLFFWHPKNLKMIQVMDGKFLYSLPAESRYPSLMHIKWETVFYKTYKEKRSWLHALVNFSRIWIIHLTMYWYYTSFNSPTLYTIGYNQLLDNQPADQVRWSIISLGGTLACIVATFANLCEKLYVVPAEGESKTRLLRLLFLIILTAINVGPSIYIIGFLPLNVHSIHGTYLGMTQFAVSVLTFLYLAIVPPDNLFSSNSFNPSTYQQFVCNFPDLSFRSQSISYALWFCTFIAKFSESYFFLTLSVRDPIRILSTMKLSRTPGDILLKNSICKHQATIVLTLLYVINLILFFLDTYLWYVIISVLISLILSLSTGVTIFTPWKNIFSKLPDRISTKITYYHPESKTNPTKLIALVWNCLIVSMYREHLLSTEQVNNLVYEKVESSDEESDNIPFIKPPSFFISQDDNSFSVHNYFTPGKQAERRISFFAQSLSCSIPDTYPTLAMPTFTVLVPHFSEKIILELREIIKEDANSKLSLLDYLKSLNKGDWENFVKDTKVSLINLEGDYLANCSTCVLPTSSAKEEPSQFVRSKIDDLPYYCIGFKDSSPENILRTRIWASLRCQTLYRTVSGFMNYEEAIRVLYKTENSDVDTLTCLLIEKDDDVELFIKRKFRMLIAMQKFQDFTQTELENIEILFKLYPNIQVSILEVDFDDNGNTSYYSCLIDSSTKDNTGKYIPRYRIKLSGNPILGDGKSDNQNNAIIFYRGEYIQVIDANQDNYLEECLKIKSVLKEFEEIDMNPSFNYIPGTFEERNSPVAILGAREYIFSESTGILGDIAAGKEKSFGTLFARSLSEVGGKLHYGHPDFLNGIFMTTRGGISKAQRGLHLNEDIYAGIMAVCRGGRIKHCDFYQCGKGRDLGFDSIQNFTTKIGAGMGEQLLSREYYYLGTKLPIDRFLSFYYAHLGFHLNNLLIMLVVQLFMIFLVNLGSLKYETILCEPNSNGAITDVLIPIGCYNMSPVLGWVNRFILSVFICFFISFVPMIVQEILDNGFIKSLTRVCLHFSSMAPLFEVFSCQMYSKSLRDNITFGGAKYIQTGRSFATSRKPFALLYSRYAGVSLYTGASHFLALIFATISMWQPSILWFWITVCSLCLAPFIFNPHQFEWKEFFLDYREFIRWMFRGNGGIQKASWVEYVKSNRMRLTGQKKHRNVIIRNTDPISKPNKVNLLLDQVLIPTITCIFLICPFLFINSQTGVSLPLRVNPLLRIGILAIGPFIVNIIILLAMSLVSNIFGNVLTPCFQKTPGIIAAVAHITALVFYVITIVALFVSEGWNYVRSISGFLLITTIHRLFSRIITISLSRELHEDTTNKAWWSGKWFGKGLEWLIFTQPIREFFIKICELNQFSEDFLLGHGLLVVLSIPMMIPYIDKWHSLSLFWLKPTSLFAYPILSKKQNRRRNKKIMKYMLLFFSINLTLLSLLLAPIFAAKYSPNIRTLVPAFAAELIQPNHQNNNDTGDANAPAYIPRVKPSPTAMKTIF